MKSPDSRSSTPAESKSSRARVRSVPHPRYPLEQVEELARRAFNIGARHCDQDAVARAFNYKNSTNGAFKGIRAAASYFGLVTYRDDHYLSVTEPWIEAFHADDELAIRRLRQEAVRQPDLYRQLIEEFAERQLPSADKLARQLFLTPKYGILKDAAETAARVFLDSVRFAGLVDSNNFLRLASLDSELKEDSAPANLRSQEDAQPNAGAREDRAAPSAAIFAAPRDDSLDRIEVQLSGGRRACLFVPVPLAAREKERLKKYIDLILEPEDNSNGRDA